MTPTQIHAVQASFALLAPQADTVAQLFYERLFEIDPSLRPMFKPDMADQRRMLMTMLNVAVSGLGRVESLLPALAGMGARHAGYGVQAQHYDTVGTALIDTLSLGLGEAFTPELREAWLTAYGLLAGAMKAGAASPSVATATA